MRSGPDPGLRKVLKSLGVVSSLDHNITLLKMMILSSSFFCIVDGVVGRQRSVARGARGCCSRHGGAGDHVWRQIVHSVVEGLLLLLMMMI
jgi:hypothetical protein